MSVKFTLQLTVLSLGAGWLGALIAAVTAASQRQAELNRGATFGIVLPQATA